MKTLKVWTSTFLSSWIFLSTAVHAGAGGGLYYWFVKRVPPPIVAELDLSMAPLIPVVPNAGGGGSSKPVETWTVSKKKKPAAPVAAAVVETKQEVVKEEARTPCVDCPTTGSGEGQYIPVEQASRKPRWTRNFITSADYPAIARQQGKDGRVVLTVLIDSSGRVRDARLLQGGYPALNEVALRKVKEAIFTPAYNERNKPVSCKVTLPIRFELR